MSSFKIFEIAASGMAAESLRLNTVASNLANANTISSSKDGVYRTRQVVFEEVRGALNGPDAGAAVKVREVIEAQADALARYEPGNPLADTSGYVYSPNINSIEQMVDMISSSRSYQNNIEVVNTSRDLMLATLRLGQ